MNNIKGYGKATRDEVNLFEQLLGFNLPDDYRQFLLDFNGGITAVQQSKFYVEALDTLIPLEMLFGLEMADEKLDLYKANEDYKEELHMNGIVIGCAPCSGKIVIFNNDDHKGIYFWDHGWYADPSNQDENIYKVAESFQSFLDGLKIPEEA